MGYTLNGSYTYQSAQGDGYGSANSYTFLYNRPLGHANEDYIAHDQFTLAQNFDLPFGRSRKFGSNWNRYVDFAVGGWNISGITTIYNGLPFSPTFTAYTRPGVGPNDRPDQGSKSPYDGAQGNRDQWFVGGLGALSSLRPRIPSGTSLRIRSMARGSSIRDISLAKSFPITERIRFTLRGDATNSFNHANLGSPNTNIADPAAGRITGLASQYTRRRLQFSGRIDF
jgi:hypothetical protein